MGGFTKCSMFESLPLCYLVLTHRVTPTLAVQIMTQVRFPLVGLNMAPWVPLAARVHLRPSQTIYDLFSVSNHLGGMSGGHYTSFCRAVPCSAGGVEEVVPIPHTKADLCKHMQLCCTLFRLPTQIFKLCRCISLIITHTHARTHTHTHTHTHTQVASSLPGDSDLLQEYSWLHFDDEHVDQWNVDGVNTNHAYLLFYRRRHLTPCNVVNLSV